MKIIRIGLLTGLLCIWTAHVSAQLLVDDSMTPEQLVQNVLVGSGITVSNVTYLGEQTQRGSFSNGETTNLDLRDGVILTSGNIYEIPDDCNGTVGANQNFANSDPDLVAISGGDIRDASVLEFDFVPQSDTLTFKYVFGSEEYNGFVCSQFNDVFGFFVSGPGISGPYTNNAENIAIIPGSLPPLAVAINTLNGGVSQGSATPCILTNDHLYVDNCGTVGVETTIEYFGFSVVLTAELVVVPCSTYHIKLAIGDAVDQNYDSGVFLEANSFSATGLTISSSFSSSSPTYGSLIEGCNDATVIFELAEPLPDPYPISFDFLGTAVNGVDYQLIPNSIVIPPGSLIDSINIIPIQNFTIDPTRTVTIALDYQSACSSEEDTLEYLLLDNTIEMSGLDTFYCSLDPPVNLTVYPPTGVLTGPGTSPPNVFDPSLANPGMNIITYSNYFIDNSTGIPDTVCISEAIDTTFMQLSASADAGSDERLCQLEPFSFASSATQPTVDFQDSLLWTGGTGTFDDPRTLLPIYTPGPGEVGPVTLTLTAYGIQACGDGTDDMILTFDSVPFNTITIVPADTSCVDEEIQFFGSAVSTVDSWQWDFGDGNTSTQQNPTHTYVAPNTYNVSLITISPEGCSDTTFVQKVIVDAQPTLDFTFVPSPSCEGFVVDFEALGPYDFTDYTWDFGDGNFGVGRLVSHTYALAATYTVTLDFCTASTQQDVLVNPAPLVFAGSDTTSCEDVPFDLSTLTSPPFASDYSTLLWTGGLGTFDDPTALAPTYTPAPGELGPVILTLTANGIAPCNPASSSVTIDVIEGAYAYAGTDEDHCQDEVFDFSSCATPPIAYNEVFRQWTHDGLGVIPDPSLEVPTYIPGPGETGVVNFTFVASNIINCDSVDYMQLTIHPAYLLSFNDTICWGDSLLLPGGSWATATGTYYDTLLTVWSCDSVIETNLFERPVIDADFVTTPTDSACQYEDILFTPTGTATLTSWFWDFGDGNTSSDPNPSHAYDMGGVYTVTFSFTDDNGCSDEVSHSITVFNNPDVDFDAGQFAACLSDSFEFFGISMSNIVLWEWDFGDGTTGFGQNTTHIYSTSGIMPVTLSVTSDNGCTNSIPKLIFVAAPPTADFTWNVDACRHMQFTDLSSAPPGFFLVEWDWDFGDGTTSDLQHPGHTYATGGLYDVKLVVYADSMGIICPDSITYQVQVPDAPTVYFSWNPEPSCLGEVTSFFGTSGAVIQQWYWDFDDGNFAYEQNPQHTYASTGTYDVVLFATDANGCTDSTLHTVTVVDVPDVSISVNPNPACQGAPTSFTGSSTAVIDTWLWDFGDGSTSIQQNPTHVYASAGTYHVMLWVGDTNDCFNQASTMVTVNPMPMAAFTVSGAGCSGDSVYFYNQSVSPNGQIIRWEWDFGDGNTATITAPDDPDIAHVYATGGTYDVTLTVLDADSCQATTLRQVTLSSSPIADFNYQDNCQGAPVQFTDLSSPNGGSPLVSWLWEFGDPASGAQNTSTLQNPTHLFTTSGTFDVLLIVRNVEGCTDTIISPVDVGAPPMVSFTTDPDSVCVDTEITFSGSASSNVSWQWDFGDGGTSVLQNPVHVYTAAGTYQVSVTVVDAGGCTGSYTDAVTVNPVPVASFAAPALPCSGSQVDFTDLSSPMNATISEWWWVFGDGSDTTIFAPGPGDVSHTYAGAGTYNVQLHIRNSNGCEDSTSFMLEVIQGPQAAFSYAGEPCQGGTIDFTDQSQAFGSAIQSWWWDFGDPASGANNTSSLQNPTHTYAGAGTYYVSLTVTAATGCESTVVDTVQIAPPPPLYWYTDPDTSCYGTTTFFFTDADSTNIAEVATYLWNFGDPASGLQNTSNDQNPVHVFTAAGTYAVSLTIVNVDGCENMLTRQVEVHARPVADFAYEQACLGDSTLFTDESVAAGSNIVAWQWDFGDGGTATVQNPYHSYAALGTYNVQLIATDELGCSDTIVQTLQVYYAPVSLFTYQQACDPPGMIYFSDSSFVQAGAPPITSWLWEIEPGYFSSEINPTYTFDQYDTCYVVSLTVTDINGCSNTYLDSVCVEQPLMVDFTATRVCRGDATFFEASYLPADDTVSIFRWDLGNGQVLLTDTDTLSYTYASPGNYFVTLTIENQQQCARSVTYEVIVDDLPGADFAFNEAVCDEPTYFTDLTDPGAGAYIVSWQWDFGDGATSTDQNPVHTYPAVDSTYLVHLLVTNSHGCVDSVSYTLSKGLCMEALFTTTGDNQCNNTEVCFTDSSYILGDGHVITRWEWDFGDGQQEAYVNFRDSICHSYDERGTYQVTLQIEAVAEGQTYYATSTQTVIVSAVPQARLATQTPCVNTLTQFFDESFTNGVEITSWWWDFGDISTDEDTSSLQHPVYRYPAPGIYPVQLIVTNANGCQDTLTENVRVYSVPGAAFSATHACAGGLVEFMDESTEAEGEITQWRWSFGDGAQSGVQDPQYVYPGAGDYDVQLVVTDENQCADTIVNALTVFEVPLSLFDLIENYENIQGQVLLDNRSEDAVRYVWDFGNGDTSQQVSPVVRYEDNGTYVIQLIAWNDSDCPDTSYMEYEVLFQGLYVPTGFTPEDNDQALRTWKPVGMNLEEYHVVVVNERGNVVFESTRLDEHGSPVEGWDGTTGGEDMPTGNYLWSISAKFKDGRVWNGNQVGDGNNKAYGYLLLIR